MEPLMGKTISASRLKKSTTQLVLLGANVQTIYFAKTILSKKPEQELVEGLTPLSTSRVIRTPALFNCRARFKVRILKECKLKANI